MSLERALALRKEGNEFFSKSEWRQAIDKYGACVKALLANGDSIDKSNLVVAYSNRAQAWLQLGEPFSALEDAEKALQLDKGHVKSLLRKATALHGMKHFEDAVSTYRMVQRAGSAASNSASGVQERLQQAVIGDKQTRAGVFDLSDWWASDGPGHAVEPAVEDYVGPVDIREDGAAGMGRGLFATEAVKAGQLLFATAPLASTQKKGVDELVAGLEAIVSKAQTNLQTFPELQRLVQIHTLLASNREVVPPMRFFKPVNSLGARDRLLSSTDLTHPALVTKFTRAMLHEICCTRSYESVLWGQVGVYALGSLMNHSCLPNAHFQYVQVGGVKFARASRQVKAGEQLFFSHVTVFCPLKERRALLHLRYGVCCTCARCVLEDRLLALVPGLKALQAECSRLWKQKDDLDTMEEGDRLRMRAACITKIDQMEAILKKDPNCVRLHEKEKNWIRSSFVRLHRLLLHPSLVLVALIKPAPLEMRKEEQRLIGQAAAAMFDVDPASPMAWSLLAQEHLVGLPCSDYKKLSTIRATGQVIYGNGLREEAYFRQWQASTGISLLSPD